MPHFHKRRARRVINTLALAAAAALGHAAPAEAALIKIVFGGFVTDVADGLSIVGGLVPSGHATRFDGSFIYDTSTANTDARPDFGFFANAVSHFTLTFQSIGQTYTQGGPQTYNNVQTGDNRTDYGNPQFDGFYAYSQWDTSAQAGGPFDYSEIGLSLQSTDLSSLVGAGLPDMLPVSNFLDPDDLVPADGLGVDRLSAGMEFHLVSAAGLSTDVFGVLDFGRSALVVSEPGSAALAALAMLALVRTRTGARAGRPGAT